MSNTRTTFIGVDLAWSEKNPSGLAVAQGSAQRAELMELERIGQPFEATAEWIADRTGDHCIVAIDAPLIVPNDSGMRSCERELSAVFRSAWAGTHSSSRALFADGGPPLLASALERRGFRHAADLDELRGPGRWMMEVYPHPALVRLFGLEIRLAYKKGTADVKRAGLGRMLSLLHSLERADPSLSPGEAGRAIGGPDAVRSAKSIEDKLDAWLCAYIALYSFRWGIERTRIFGTISSGYIVVPDAPLHDLPVAVSTQPPAAEARPRPPRRSALRGTTAPGFVNRNRQTVLRTTGRPGTDHGQRIYALACNDCGSTYGVNGSGIFQSRCPNCQGGAPGLVIE